MTTEKGNKLIAEFVGLKIGDAWQVWNNKADYSNAAEFEYHSSWDWLMPVVERIEWLDRDYYFEIKGKSCIVVANGYSLHDTFWQDSKIKSVWLAVIEFIKWLNNQNQNQNV